MQDDRMAVRPADPGRERHERRLWLRHDLRGVPGPVRPGRAAVHLARRRRHVERAGHDERRAQVHGQAEPRDLAIRPRRLRRVQRQVRNMVVASHDFGATFLPPQKVNDDHLWWYANGGAMAPNGDVYFAMDGEASLSGHGHDFDGPDEVALLRCSPSPTTSCANPTLTSFGVAAPPPPCAVPGCYPDYFAATGAIAIDGSGHMAFAYTFSSVANGPKSLYVRTSDDGVHWAPARWSTTSATATSRRSPPAASPATSVWPGRTTGRAGTTRGTRGAPTAGRPGVAGPAVEPGSGRSVQEPEGLHVHRRRLLRHRRRARPAWRM